MKLILLMLLFITNILAEELEYKFSGMINMTTQLDNKLSITIIEIVIKN
jgi:hypothetical protein